jgi:hypothetical protein
MSWANYINYGKHFQLLSWNIAMFYIWCCVPFIVSGLGDIDRSVNWGVNYWSTFIYINERSHIFISTFLNKRHPPGTMLSIHLWFRLNLFTVDMILEDFTNPILHISTFIIGSIVDLFIIYWGAAAAT